MELNKVKNHNQLQEILNQSNWKKFENIVGKIFELHEYDVEVSKVIRFENTKRQYDVIAKQNHCIIVDCKKWDNKRKIKYNLKKAAEDQIGRVKKLTLETVKYPMIVTSRQSPIEYSARVPIIPVYKLNEFLLKFQINKQNILTL